MAVDEKARQEWGVLPQPWFTGSVLHHLSYPDTTLQLHTKCLAESGWTAIHPSHYLLHVFSLTCTNIQARQAASGGHDSCPAAFLSSSAELSITFNGMFAPSLLVKPYIVQQ